MELSTTQKTKNMQLEKVDDGSITWKSIFPNTFNKDMEKIDGLFANNPVSTITKIAPYLYDITYTDYDFDKAQKYLAERYLSDLMGDDTAKESKLFAMINPFGGCSSAHKGNLYCRQYDWYYSDAASFVIHTKARDGRYASVGVTAGLSNFSADIVDKREPSDIYDILPYITLDGINEHGVIASINVVPAGDWGYTRGTYAGAMDICVLSLPRYVLDNYASADAAAADIRANKFNVWSPAKENGVAIEIHMMIADKNKTYEVEFVDLNGDGYAETNVIDITDRPVVTNFYLTNTENNLDGTIKYESVTPHGTGLERYDTLIKGLENVHNRVDMRELAKKVYFTLAYKFPEGYPKLYTELCGKTDTFGDLTVMDAKLRPELFDPILNYVRRLWELHKKDNSIWQTVHSSVYDIDARKLYIEAQEKETEYVFDIDTSTNLVATKISGLTFNDFEIKSTDFIAYTPSTIMSAYGYKAEINLGDSVKSGARCICQFPIEDEIEKNFVCEKVYNGKLTIYAKTQKDVLIDLIVIF